MNPLKAFRDSRNIDLIETLIPLCDILNIWDSYIISLEVSGKQKDKIEVKATDDWDQENTNIKNT